MEVLQCWFKYDKKLKAFDLSTKYFPSTSENLLQEHTYRSILVVKFQLLSGFNHPVDTIIADDHAQQVEKSLSFQESTSLLGQVFPRS